MRARALGVALGFVALGVVGATAWSARYRYDPTGGPIDSSENGLAYSQPLEVGQDFSIGITALFNDGKKPAIVDKVRLLGVTGPLELLGVHTRHFPEGNVGTFPADFGFPPDRYPAKPLTEQNVVPGSMVFNDAGESIDGLELVIGIRAMRPGISAYRAVEVHYRVGRRRYRELFEANHVHLCAPLSDYVDVTAVDPGRRTLRDCPPRELEDKFEDRVLEWPPPAAKDASAR
jgi:hypothetical protein